MDTARLLAALSVGFVSGVLSGMFGIGGGIVTTPAIRLLLGYPALIAVGTPLPVIVPSAVTGAIGYARRGLADVRFGLVVGLVGMPFAVGGAWLADLVGGPAVMVLTAVLIVWVAGLTAFARRAPAPTAEAAPPPGGTEPVAAPRPGTAGLAALGCATGLYSGLLGLGGGFVIVPALTHLFAFPMKRAIGTSLVAVALLAVPGTLAHWWLGHIDVRLALTLALSVVPGAMLGARVTAAASERHVRLVFAAFLAVVGALLLFESTGVL